MRLAKKWVIVLFLISAVAFVHASGGKEAGTVKIGAIFSITGPSFLGVPEERTAEMVVDEINAKGGIKGMKLELIVKDDGGKGWLCTLI